MNLENFQKLSIGTQLVSVENGNRYVKTSDTTIQIAPDFYKNITYLSGIFSVTEEYLEPLMIDQ